METEKHERKTKLIKIYEASENNDNLKYYTVVPCSRECVHAARPTLYRIFASIFLGIFFSRSLLMRN